MSTLRISLLGGVRVKYEDSSSIIDLTPGLEVLLAYIVSQRQKSHTRLSLVDRFWPDFSEKRAQGCLRTALWRLKQALKSPEELSTSYFTSNAAHDICFNCDNDYWLDVEQFEKGLAEWARPVLTDTAVQRLESVLDLYTGEFLNGHYDDWIILERERLESLYINGLFFLMRHYKQEQSFDKGVVCGQKILRIDMLREEIHRELMRIYALTGRRSLAIRQFNYCTAVLNNELNIDPMPETVQLYQQILTDTVTAPGDSYGQGAVHDDAQKRFQKALAEFETAFHHLQQATNHLYGDKQVSS